jgi:molecular chaperone GrpE
MQNEENSVKDDNNEKPIQEAVAGDHELADAGIESTDLTAKLEAEITKRNDDYMRLMAEFENYKKRVRREREEQLKMISSGILLELLPIVDDFDLAVKSGGSNANSSVSEGMILIHKKLRAMLESKGVKPMDAQGQKFDSDLYDAIAQTPAPSEDQKGLVLEEVAKGYFLHDKVLRHAKVIVGI